MELNLVLNDFIQSRKMYGLAEKSIYDYKSFCDRFIREIDHDTELEELSQNDINNYVMRLMDSL